MMTLFAANKKSGSFPRLNSSYQTLRQGSDMGTWMAKISLEATVRVTEANSQGLRVRWKGELDMDCHVREGERETEGRDFAACGRKSAGAPCACPYVRCFSCLWCMFIQGGGQYSIDMLTHGKLHLSEGMLFLVSALAYKDLLFITSLTQRLPTAALCCNHCPVHDKIYLFTMLAQGVAVFFSTIDH